MSGCCGLSLAQGLKNVSLAALRQRVSTFLTSNKPRAVADLVSGSQSGIASIVYEQDDAPNSRTRDWNFSLHWAVPTLKSLVSTELFSRIDSTQVDPHQQPLETEILNMVNGATGEVLRSIPIPASYRMRRSKLKALLAEGIDVRYKKELQNIRYSEDGETVTAQFGDGTIASGCLLVGVDGSRSRTRNLLLGPKEAALSPIPYAASFVQCQYSREQALFLRKSFRLFVAAIHPLGLFSWFGLHDVPDPDRPETWIFYTYISYPSSIQEQSETADWTNAMKMEHLKGMAKDFADPWKSAYAWMPADQPVWQHGMTSWDPSTRGHRWEMSGGRVTLGGDAAHPMTYRPSFPPSQPFHRLILSRFMLTKS